MGPTGPRSSSTSGRPRNSPRGAHPGRRASRPLRLQPDRHRAGAAAGLPLDHRAPAGAARRPRRTARSSSTTSSSGIRAARGFWFLELFGHQKARLLDGGFNAWLAEKRQPSRTTFAAPVATEWRGTRRGRHPRHLARRPRAARPRRRRHPRHAGRAEEYYGTMVRAARGGAIPGAVHSSGRTTSTPAGRSSRRPSCRTMYARPG